MCLLPSLNFQECVFPLHLLLCLGRSSSLQFVFFAGGGVLPKHNAEGPARAAAEVQVDQARQGGRDVGAVVSERAREGLPNEIYQIRRSDV